MAVANCTKVCSTALSTHAALAFRTTFAMNHNPGLKKKKKVVLDPKKLQKQLERQEMKRRKEPVVVPVDPDSLPDASWFDADRTRPTPIISEEKSEERILLQKEWTRHLMRTHVADLRMLQEKLRCRNDALRELKKVSEFLYNEAIKVDKTIFPLKMMGPMETPPINDYVPPDFAEKK